MSQGFVNAQNIALPLAVSQGGTGSTTAEQARNALDIANPNIIIGGNFTTNPWQRGTSFAAATDFTADRFKYQVVGSGVVTVTKNADSPTPAEAGVYSTSCLMVDVTTADGSLAASDAYGIAYVVEGYDISQAGFGISGTRYVTLSFWHKHTKTGTYSGSFRNDGATRSYVFEYTQAVSDTWEFSEITVPVDTTGTWLYTNGAGLRIWFSIANGSTGQAAAGSWATANNYSSTNQVNGMDNTANNFRLALIKLELGSYATPYPVESESDILRKCQRYFYKTYSQGVNPGTVDTNGALGYNVIIAGVSTRTMNVFYPVPMRETPTITFYNPAAANSNWRNFSDGADSAAGVVGINSDNNAMIQNAQVAGDGIGETLGIHLTASAEI